MKAGHANLVVLLVILVVILSISATLMFSGAEKIPESNNIEVATGKITTQGYVGIEIEPRAEEGAANG